MNSDDSRYVGFALGGIQFEYDENKNQNDRIEYFDEQESREEDRFDIIGDLSAGSINLFGGNDSTIGNIGKDTVVFVVYTERVKYIRDNKEVEVIRIISARYATSFERGIYYGKY